jgi:hypothetical protein
MMLIYGCAALMVFLIVSYLSRRKTDNKIIAEGREFDETDKIYH